MKELVSAVFERFPGRGADLNVLQAIAEAANPQGYCLVAQVELAAAARVSHASVGPAIRRLRRDRWIVTGDVPGWGRRLAYQINLPKLGRSCRPDHDPDRTQTDAILAARRATERKARKYATREV